MKTLSLVGLLIASSFLLTACNSDGIKTLNALENDWNKRHCGSNGDVTITAGAILANSNLTGHMAWDCPKGVPATIPVPSVPNVQG